MDFRDTREFNPSESGQSALVKSPVDSWYQVVPLRIGKDASDKG
jgi:hypothetical protein